jgi:RNA polymerase sigma-32 factor
MTTLPLPAVPLDGGLSQYFQQVFRFPVLKGEKEYMLAKRWKEHGDVEAAHELVTSHLRLVAKIAMSYRGYGLPVADLVSEGNIGLMKAVRKFEPEKGFRLSTYAMWWIRASITEYILKSWSLVKLGTVAAQKKMFFSLRKLKGRLKIMDNGELSPDQATILAKDLNVSESDVIGMNRRLASRDLSLNTPVSDENATEFQDTLVDESPSPEAIVADGEEMDYRRGLLRDAMKVLPARERHILTERRLKDEPITLEELGKNYGISRERVRQLEVRAFEKVTNAIEESVAEDAR